MAFDLTSEVSEIWRLEHELKLEMSCVTWGHMDGNMKLVLLISWAHCYGFQFQTKNQGFEWHWTW